MSKPRDSEIAALEVLKYFYPLMKEKEKELKARVVKVEDGVESFLGGKEHKPIWEELGRMYAYRTLTEALLGMDIPKLEGAYGAV